MSQVRHNLQINITMDKTFKFFLSIVLLHSANQTCYFMASAAMNNTTSNITAADQTALLAFKSHITLDPLNILANNWSSSSSVCNWVGVSCDASNERVTNLNLANMGLFGSIPPQLGNLSFLVHLDLHNNRFRGDLPKELASLRNLKLLNLCTNNFTGEFPEWIGELSQLQNLSLCNNSFAGFVPELGRLLPNLMVLDLAYNRLSGIIPSSMFNISSLQVIDISYNSFSGMFYLL